MQATWTKDDKRATQQNKVSGDSPVVRTSEP